MKKVLFLLHGGTIAQIQKKRDNGEKYLAPAEDPEQFLEACSSIIDRFENDLEVVCEFVTAKDSSNVQPQDWTRLAKRVKKAQNVEDYDGVVITHGTDTLGYTASALAFALHGSNPNGSSLRIPVCITGSQKTIYAQPTDAHHNLHYAFKTISQAAEDGVADVLVNFSKEVMLGARIVKVSETDYTAFASPNYPNIGTIKNQTLFLSRDLVNTADRFLPTTNDQINFESRILSISLTPGLSSEVLLTAVKNSGIKALILRSFAAGNLPFEAEGDLSQAVKVLSQELNIPVFLTSKVPSANASSTEYEAGLKALESGAIPCYDQTEAVIAVKVAWLLGNGICEKVRDFDEAMKTNYVGETSRSIQTLAEEF